jgi:hypothetical protein
MNGTLLRTLEKFYAFKLHEECMQQAVSELNLTEIFVPESITNDSVLNCCDFYQKGYGYEFTNCDMELGAIVFNDRKSGPIHEEYLNMAHEFNELDWNWLDLESLVVKYCANDSAHHAAVDPGPIDLPMETAAEGEEVMPMEEVTMNDTMIINNASV